MQLILVLLQEVRNVVVDRPSVVNNSEIFEEIFHVLHIWSLEVRVLAVSVLVEEFLEKALIRPSWNIDLLVHHGENASSLRFKQVQCWLIVYKCSTRDGDTLLKIKGLLHAEDVLIEVILQLLVTVVDTQLLEGINLHINMLTIVSSRHNC